MTVHDRTIELAAVSLDFGLSAHDRAELDRHVASCMECRSDLDGLVHDARRLAARPAVGLRVDRAEAIRASLEHPRRSMSPAMVLAAAVLLLLAALAALAVGAGFQRLLDPQRLAVQPAPSIALQAPVTAPTPTPAPSASPSWTIEWTALDEPAIRPKRGFEHSFLDSARGTMIQVRHLEGKATTIVAATRDGVSWTADEVASDTIPAGQAVNGGADWMQLVEAGGRLHLWASRDGFAWERRGALPKAIAHAWDSAVNGSTILVCGAGTGKRLDLAECARSADTGATWAHLPDLGPAIGTGGILGIVPLGGGFVLIVEGPNDGESVALTSDDGLTWARQPGVVPNRATAVAAIGDTVVAYGATAGGGPASMAVTGDAVSWETVAVPASQGSIHWFVRAAGILAGAVMRAQPEGADLAMDILLSGDGRTWIAGGIPAAMADWQNPTFLHVDGGVIVLGGDAGQMMLGSVTPTDTP